MNIKSYIAASKSSKGNIHDDEKIIEALQKISNICALLEEAIFSSLWTKIYIESTLICNNLLQK